MSAVRQVRALFALRWQMIRSDGVRAAVVLIAIGIAYLLVLVAGGAQKLDPVQVATAVEVAPQAFLGFGVLALIAPLTAGGGNEVLPSSQLVAYPVTPRTQFLGGLLLAPVNLVWVLQILSVAAVTSCLTVQGPALRGGLVAALFVAALTAVGQALAWCVVGLRQTRRGRQAVATAGALLVTTVVLVVRSGNGRDVLDQAPTRLVVEAITTAHRTRWTLTAGVLAVLTVGGLVLGARTCAWALRRPADTGAQRASKLVRRRPSTFGPLRTLVAADRASVWRAPALRRGGLVLGILPGLGALTVGLPWESMVVLPGLVAAGAGLLFGVNAFCLDGSGAIFLASLPHDPKLVARAKALVLTETVLAAVVLSAVAGSLRSPGSPTLTQVVGIATSGLLCTALVVSRGMAASVRRPHRADLAGPRDAVAPPGALVLASAQLALPAGLVGLLMQSSTATHVWWVAPVVATPLLALCVLSLARSFRRWDDPRVRSRIVQTVSAG